MADRIFLREVRLENIHKTLLFYQNSIGNVSCVVWDAALVLTKYLEKQSTKSPFWLKGLRIVELGAGLGCVGIAAACYGGDVIMTDLPEVVPQLEKTIDLNRAAWSEKGKISAVALAWGHNKPIELEFIHQQIDIILMSDCVYYEESVDPLIETLKSLTSKTTEIILCQEQRDTEKQKAVWKSFMNKLYEDFSASKIPVYEQDELYASPDIVLLKVKKK